jgi:RNA polymerase sigma-70 factor, ECF subfamily
MVPIDMQDTDLMLRVQNGDEAAFNVIVDKYQRRILDLCTRYVGNQSDGEEVAMDVFFQLYRTRLDYRPEAKLSTYLYRIAVNRSLNRIRDRKRRRLVSFEWVRRDRPFEPGAPDAERPDSQLEAREREALVRRAVDGLPDKQKTALLLRRTDELSYEEIASAMGTTVSAVESLLFRARETLKKRLKPLI